jgi:hypothetical protein
MRLAGKEKLGFYATPPLSQIRIINFLQGERKGVTRLLDPCAGYGVAISAATEHLKQLGANTKSYGVELSDERGPSLRQAVDHGIHGDWANVSMTAQSVSLLWANPPYDQEMISSEDVEKGEKSQRMEYRFLQSSMPKLAYDGVLVYIVPLHILQTKRYASYICNHFRDIRIYRFPDEEYDAYKQVVLFAYRKKYSAGGINEIIPEYGLDELPPVLPTEPDAHYLVPALPNQKINYHIDILEDEVVLARVRSHGAHTTRQWAQHTQAKDESEFQPIVKLNTGHIGHLITSGQIGVVQLPNQLTIGRVSKAKDIIVKGTYIDAEGEEKQNVIARDHFVTTVTSLTRQGEIKTINSSDGLEQLINEYGQEIGDIVEKKYEPIYTGPTDKEWLAMAPLMKKRLLKGRADTGLFHAQKHAAIAMKRAIDKKKWVILVGEMGVGKTPISLATASLRDQWPVLVLCPPILTKKWAAEVPDVIPGARGFIIESLNDLETFVKDWRPGRKWVAVLSKEDAKLTPGWRHSWSTAHKRVAYTTPKGESKNMIVRIMTCPSCGQPIKDDKEQFIPVPTSCDKMTEEDIAQLPGAGKKRLTCRNPRPAWKGEPNDNTAGAMQENNARGKPRQCGTALWSVDSTKAWQEYSAETCRKAIELKVHPSQVPDATLDPIGDNKGDHTWREGRWMTKGMRRWAIADYIHDQLAGSKKFFKLLIADECHELKAKNSAQAMAYHALRDACGATINLTGTIFNGKSTSLFWTLYRNDREIRRLYNFNSETAWAEYYGRLERSMNEEMEEKESTTHSLKGKHENKAKEIPGISPAIYSRLLPNTIFFKKDDLGWKLPPYSEQIIRVSMGKAQAEQYNWAIKLLFEHVMSGLRSNDKIAKREATRLMSTWLQRALGRADTGFRREMVMWKAQPGDGKDAHEPYSVMELKDYGYDSEHQLVLPNDPDMPLVTLHDDPEWSKWSAKVSTPMLLDRIIDVDCLLPKEHELLKLVREEVDAGNKFLVYVNQTAKNDIQPRLKTLLDAKGLRTTILPKGIAPENRDAWIKKNHQTMDVLICNPRAVETGLDLVQFNRIAYYELPVRLETLQQSAARIYRIGQTRETKVYFFIYRGTMEEQFLSLVREKIKAAAALYGDNIASAIVDDADDGDDLTRELINRLMAGKMLEVDSDETVMGQTLAAKPPDPRWAEHILTQAQATIEAKTEANNYLRTNWLDFFQEDGSKTPKPKSKGNQKPAEAQLLLF